MVYKCIKTIIPTSSHVIGSIILVLNNSLIKNKMDLFIKMDLLKKRDLFIFSSVFIIIMFRFLTFCEKPGVSISHVLVLELTVTLDPTYVILYRSDWSFET